MRTAAAAAAFLFLAALAFLAAPAVTAPAPPGRITATATGSSKTTLPPAPVRHPGARRPNLRNPTPSPAPCGRARLQLHAFSSRIAGGFSNPPSASYHAALFSGVRRCTGTLVSRHWLLSAAHCSLLLGDKVQIGGPSATTGSTRFVKRIVRHPSFMRDATKVANDVMLVRLDAPAPGPSVRINNSTAAFPPPGTLARASGYGRTSTAGARGPLRYADLDVISAADCSSVFGRHGLNFLAKGVTDAVHICANHDACDTGPCFGDSGGPLVVADGAERPVVVGVASYGSAECGSRHTPDVYARVGRYAGWIDAVTVGEAEFVKLG